MRHLAGFAAALALAGCGGGSVALDQPGHGAVGAAAPRSEAARRSLARSAIEAATRCAVRPETLRLTPDGAAARLDCSVVPLIET